MRWSPDQAVVISLERRPDRRKAQGNLAARLGFPVQTSWAVEGKQVDVPATWGASVAAYANMLSHRAVLERAGDGPILVLEDDAQVPPDFSERLDALMTVIPPQWEAVWLGGEHLRIPSPVRPGLVRCRRAVRTHAYLMRGYAISTALQVTRAASDRWDMSLGMALGSRHCTFAPDPFLIGTTGVPGDIPGSVPLGELSKGRT